MSQSTPTSISALEADIAARRARLADTLSELSYRTQPKVIADRQKQAAQALMEAAEMLSREPAAMQLRYLQTLTQVAGDRSSTIVFPVPVQMMERFFSQSTSDGPSAP